MNVKHYVDDELFVAQSWIQERGYIATVERNNSIDKKAADILMTCDNIKYLLEVKIEDDWPYKTGNITFDIISAFQWTAKPVTKCSLEELKSKIIVNKWGSLYDENYNILLKQIRNTTTGEFVNIAYSAAKLRSYIPYFEKFYPVRVNPKWKYGLQDSWESAFMCVPLTDSNLVKALI